MNILIVNDITLEADTLKTSIRWEELGIHNAFVAYSAEDARTVIREQKVDILLSDIEMPGENGLALITWIRSENLDIDCILATCHADFAYARDGLSLGCLEYILMPADFDTIAKAIQKTVENRTQRLTEKTLSAYGKTWLQSQNASLEAAEPRDKYTAAEIAAECERLIRENLSDENLSVYRIATGMYLNPISLNRIYKREKGQNLSQFITHERMELVGLLMRTTQFSAANIALNCGYPNYPYFTTVFKKYYGCTPSQYRKSPQGQALTESASDPDAGE